MVIVLRIFLLFLGLCLLLTTGCTEDSDPVVPITDPPLYTSTMFCPKQAPADVAIPVAVYFQGTNPREDWLEICQLGTSTQPSQSNLTIRRGRGSAILPAQIDSAVTVQVTMASIGALPYVMSREVEILHEYETMTPFGALGGDDLSWDSSRVVLVLEEITVPAGSTLEIGAGTVILLGDKVNIIVEGKVNCMGTVDQPVLFSAADPDLPWGEMRHHSGENFYQYTFITGGGGDPSRSYGHSGSQPVIMALNCWLKMEYCFILDNPGKAFGGGDADVELKSCLISRCDTGGEFSMRQLLIEDCWFLEFPSDSNDTNEDDNDAIYLLAGQTTRLTPYRIRNSVFETGLDDGIDQNGANVSIQSCVISDFDNEGVACSNINKVSISNTLVRNCEQGIEAGYGAPDVFIDHCLMLENETGFRFGDWYEQNCHGSMTITSSISENNSLHNVWNYEVKSDAPVDSAINLTYSLVNQVEYDSGNGCITGEPQFDGEFRLLESSPGWEAGSDGKSMGLLDWGWFE